MKREMLKELGLEDEAIEKIISENGKDIEATKAKSDKSQEIENLKLEIKTKDDLIANTNSEMEKFKTMDIEGIKNKVTELEGKNKEYETQLATSKETYEKQIADQQYDFAVREFTGQHKFANDFVKDAFINDFKTKGLKLEDGKFLGADDHVKNFMEKNPGVFATEEAPKDPQAPSYDFVAPTGGQTPKSKMSVSEWMKAKNANPSLQLPDEF